MTGSATGGRGEVLVGAGKGEPKNKPAFIRGSGSDNELAAIVLATQSPCGNRIRMMEGGMASIMIPEISIIPVVFRLHPQGGGCSVVDQGNIPAPCGGWAFGGQRATFH